jgi:hypothetical protein
MTDSKKANNEYKKSQQYDPLTEYLSCGINTKTSWENKLMSTTLSARLFLKASQYKHVTSKDVNRRPTSVGTSRVSKSGTLKSGRKLYRSSKETNLFDVLQIATKSKNGNAVHLSENYVPKYIPSSYLAEEGLEIHSAIPGISPIKNKIFPGIPNENGISSETRNGNASENGSHSGNRNGNASENGSHSGNRNGNASEHGSHPGNRNTDSHFIEHHWITQNFESHGSLDSAKGITKKTSLNFSKNGEDFHSINRNSQVTEKKNVYIDCDNSDDRNNKSDSSLSSVLTVKFNDTCATVCDETEHRVGDRDGLPRVKYVVENTTTSSNKDQYYILKADTTDYTSRHGHNDFIVNFIINNVTPYPRVLTNPVNCKTVVDTSTNASMEIM